MKNNKATQVFIGLLVLVFIGLVGARFWGETQPGPHDVFAQCIADSGAKFYGASWCPHCTEQKAIFGNSSKLLPYIECSTPDGKSQTQQCTDAKITGYPTWRFADGSELSGKQSLATLSAKTNCSIDGEAVVPTAETPATTTTKSDKSPVIPGLQTSVEVDTDVTTKP